MRSPKTRWIAATTIAMFVILAVYRLILIAIGTEPPAVDLHLVATLRSADDLTLPGGPSWLRSMARDVTSLGGPVLLTMTVLFTTGWLALRAQYRGIIVLLAATSGGALLAYGFKYILARPRPPFLEHSAHPLASSFPSGHATMAAAVYLTVAVVLVRLVKDSRQQKLIIATAVAVTLLVGVSRVYLAAHYPSDVLAGWLMGSSWALLCALAARGLQRERILEEAK